MTKLISLAALVRQNLIDPDEKRYSADLLTCAIHQALALIDLKLPQTIVTEVTVESGGRDQPMHDLSNCLYMIKLATASASGITCELEPEMHFSYQMTGDAPTLHFFGEHIPQMGEIFQVHYAAANTVEGLDEAVSTSLPAICEPALITGAVSQAYSLRAACLFETYGASPEEIARLLEASRTTQDRFDQMLTGLKVLQEFGYPPGFALDAWDNHGSDHVHHRG